MSTARLPRTRSLVVALAWAVASALVLSAAPRDPADQAAPGPLPGTSGYGGGESGFVLQFTNGLTVYLTGDTGMFGDMASIIARYYAPKLVVINIGDIQTMGPDEAAFAIQHLVRPTTVMPSHANEQSTANGVMRGGTRVEWFADRVRPYAGMVLPLSGIPRDFDGEGRCIDCR